MAIRLIALRGRPAAVAIHDVFEFGMPLGIGEVVAVLVARARSGIRTEGKMWLPVGINHTRTDILCK